MATLAALLAILPAGAKAGDTLAPKALPLTSKLVVPYFEVDTLDPGGTTLLYAIRNESTASIQVDIKYYEIDSPFAPQRTDRVTLAAKEIKTINVRDISNLEVDGDGFKRGYIRFEQVSGAGVLAGDFFRVDPDDNFSSGYRMVNADPANASDDRCSIFTFRFLKGGIFSGGTRIFYWLDSAVLPGVNAIAYSIYDEPGNLLVSGVLANTDRVASKISIDQLLTGPAADLNAGAVEIQFTGFLGHVAGTISASGRFSVGFEGVCRQ